MDEKTPGSVRFSHFSPYVICGDPADDANPMTGPATGGLVIRGKTTGSLEISACGVGHIPFPVKEVTGPFELDLTDLVKGHYGWDVAFTWKGSGGLDQVRFTMLVDCFPTLDEAVLASWTADGRGAPA